MCLSFNVIKIYKILNMSNTISFVLHSDGLPIIMNTRVFYKRTKMKNYQRRNKTWHGKYTVEL